MAPNVTGVHFVGSIPLSNTDEVFTTVFKALSSRIKRLPDGETGERNYFVHWQMRVLKKYPLLLKSRIRRVMGLQPEEAPTLSEEEKRAALEEMRRDLDTEWHIPALKSYASFVELRNQGVVEKGVRFMACLPTPMTMVTLYVRPDLWVDVEKVYEEGLMRSLRIIVTGIPAEDLAIQWDVPVEFGFLENADLWDVLQVEEFLFWKENDRFEGVVGRLVRLVESVEQGAEVGLHLCYGDLGHVHFVEPKDAGLLTQVAKAVLDRSKRPVAFVHLPVPKARDDVQYFEPLRVLASEAYATTEISLGLVHSDDFDGAKRRIEAAGEVLPAFSISSECGLGRWAPESLERVLKDFKELSQPVDRVAVARLA